MSEVVSWNLQVSIRDGRLDEFRSLMQEMVESTKTESGALVYEWFLSEDNTTCHIYERYANSSAVMEHLGNFGPNFAERFVENVQPTTISVYGEPTAVVRKALGVLGPEFLEPFGGFSR